MESSTFSPLPQLPADTQGFVFDLGSLYAFFYQFPDFRKKRGIRYSLAHLLVWLTLAKCCGQDTPSAIADWVQARREWLCQALHLQRSRLPHHTTYRRVLEKLGEGDAFEQLLHDFWSHVPQVGQSVEIVLDGKSLRGTISPQDPFGLHLLAAYLPGEGIVLMQLVVEKDKENEIVVAPHLLECLDLHGKVISADALHTQRKLSAQIVEAGGEYVWIVKENQPTTHRAIEELFAPPQILPGMGAPPLDFCSAKTVDKGHGRLEERTLTLSSALNDYLDWPYLGQVFKLERRFTELHSGAVQVDVAYGLTSLTRAEAHPQRLLRLVRSEWGIENDVHYRRDVTFHEDQTRMNKRVGRAMAALNNLIISLFSLHGYRNVAQARRVLDARPQDALAILCGL